MQTKLALTDAVTAAALDKRLCTMEEQLHSAHSEAADATSCARGVQQRIAAAEWRIEKVPPEVLPLKFSRALQKYSPSKPA